MKSNIRTSAFTLIELLIVVLIIAILAAIAVPNFLEFQVRAKISRVKSDMRSLATAIEAYRVDNDVYPPTALHSQGGRAVSYPRGFVCGDEGGWLVTTPIAYITTWPKDTFPDSQGWSVTNPKGRPNRPIYYDCFEDLDPPGSNSLFFNPSFQGVNAGVAERRKGINWALFSPGPTARNETPGSEGDNTGWYNYQSGIRTAFPSVLNHYDPTNGTRSTGALARYSSGEMNFMEGE